MSSSLRDWFGRWYIRHTALQVRLFTIVGNGWPHNALRYHQLMPINCHFRDCKALLFDCTHISSAVASTRIRTLRCLSCCQHGSAIARFSWQVFCIRQHSSSRPLDQANWVGPQLRLSAASQLHPPSLFITGFDNDGHKPCHPTWWNLSNDVNELNCTSGVSFSGFHCCGRHGHGLWPSWYRPFISPPKIWYAFYCPTEGRRLMVYVPIQYKLRC